MVGEWKVGSEGDLEGMAVGGTDGDSVGGREGELVGERVATAKEGMRRSSSFIMIWRKIVFHA